MDGGRDPISDEECILICLNNAPCGTDKKQVARLIDEIQIKVYVELRAAVDDSAGNAVRAACAKLSDMTFNKLRLGKTNRDRFRHDNEEYANEKWKNFANDSSLTGVEDYEFTVWSEEQ